MKSKQACFSPSYPTEPSLISGMGKCLSAWLDFVFLKTKVFGLTIPFHANFDEVNLRFYVRRQIGDEVRRGVVFIREIVPRWAIAFVARTFYHENYVALPMAHEIRGADRSGLSVEYRWRSETWSAIRLEVPGRPKLARDGLQEQFITEHYWGYAAQPNGGCVEYRVTHPAWRVWSASPAEFEGDVERLYGKDMAAVLRGTPASAFLAEGSGRHSDAREETARGNQRLKGLA
jgi:uncharacterized protein